MKQLNLMLASIALGAAGTFGAQAELIQGYTCDFNTEINTSAHDFRVASNWKHIVHKFNDGYSDYYMSYTYKPTDGVNGSGSLYAGEQRAGDNYDYEYTYDLLVTPEVEGTVKLNLKRYNTKGYVEFYALNEDGTAYQGSPLKKVSAGEMSETEFREFSLEVEDVQRIGIRASYVYLDDFYAQTANIEAEKSIRILSAEPQGARVTGTWYWPQQPDGSVRVAYSVTIMNNGDADLVQGEKNYSISIVNSRTNQPIGAPVPVPCDLAVGATSEPFDVVIDVTDITDVWPNTYTYPKLNVRENLQKTVLETTQSGYDPYESKFNLYGEDGRTSLKSIAFGVVDSSVSKAFNIANTGNAPLQIVSVTAPEGYTVTPEIPSEGEAVDGGSSKQLTLTLSSIGSHSGNLTIIYRKYGEDTDRTETIAVSGTMVAAGAWFEDFNHTDANITWPEGSIAQSNVNVGTTSYGDIYDNYIKSDYNYEGTNLFITPLLTGAAGDELMFDVGRNTTSAGRYLNVYITKDRNEKGEPVLTVPVSDFSDDKFKPYSVALPEDGDYYVVFELYGMKLDNLAGLAKKEVAHDVYYDKLYLISKEQVQTGQTVDAYVDIIPLKAMAASEYDVKLYLNGSVVATAEGEDIAASAKNSKRFSLPFTAESDKTVTWSAYFAVEFTDGTSIRSAELELTITNEPHFSFNDAGLNRPDSYNEPVSKKNAIDFGKVNELGLVMNYEICNWGSAPLTVKSITLPEGFDTEFSECAVPAKSLLPVDITFSADKAGIYNGELKITYVDAEGADAEFSLPVQGVLLDPAKWYVTFGTGSDNKVWPAGSVYQKNVSLNTPTYSNVALNGTSSKTSSDRMFISPKLVAEAGEMMTFDLRLASAYRTSGGVTVYAAKTRDELADENARTLLGDFCGDNTEEATKPTAEFSTFSVTVPEAGEYYIGFELYDGIYVDDIYGLTVADVAHDLILVSAEIPSAAMQNVAKTAVMKVVNVGLAAEEAGSYTVTAYIDGTPVSEEGSVEIPAVNRLTDSVDVPVVFRSPKAGTFPVSLELTAGELRIVTAPQDVVFEEETAAAEITVGESAGYNSDVWVRCNYYNSETIALYTPMDLGLSGGEKIEKIALRGYSTVELTGTLKIYYQWTDETVEAKPATSSNFDYSAMICYYDGEHKWEKIGSSSSPVDYLTLEFDEPIVYEAGKSLRIFIANHSSEWKSGVNFEYSKKTGNTWHHYNDGTPGVLTGTWSEKALPVLHMSLKAEERTLSGTVEIINGEPMAGAEVTLVSADGDNVQYSATSDTDGVYRLNVIQIGRVYDVNVKGDGFQEFEDGLDFAEASLVRDYTLRPVITVSDDAIHSGGAENAVVYIEKSLSEGFNAIALPVSLDSDEVDEIFGTDAIVLQFVSDEGNASAVKANFAEVNSIVAGQPYLLWLAEPSAPVMFRSRNVVEKLIDNPGTGITFKPTDRPMQMAEGMFVLTEDNFEPAAKAANMAREAQVLPAYSAYIKGNTDAVKSLTFTTDADIPSGIEDAAYEEQGEDRIYNLDGIRVKNPEKGIYIINGKAILVK